MKKVIAILGMVMVIFTFGFSAFANQVLDEKAEKIVSKVSEKYPQRFISRAEIFNEFETSREGQIYNLIKEDILLPGTNYVLLDGSIAYRTAPADSFMDILWKIRGNCNKKILIAEAKKQGLKFPIYIVADDIFVFDKQVKKKIKK